MPLTSLSPLLKTRELPPRPGPRPALLRGLDAVLLDLDGTLVDSNDAHAQAWTEAFVRGGFWAHFEDIRPLIGMGSDKLLPKAVGLDPKDDTAKALSEEHGQLFRSHYLPRLRPFRGARLLVETLQALGLKTVLATSSDDADLEALLEQTKLLELFPEKRIASASDARRSKPDPDIVRAALKRSGASASRAVLIGDTPYDMEAAHRAGLKAWAFRCGGHWSADELGADLIFEGPLDLLAHLGAGSTLRS